MKTSIICINAVFSILNTHPLFKSRFLYFFLEIKVNSQGKRCVVKANGLTNKKSQSTQSSSWSPVSSFEKYLRVLDAINKKSFFSDQSHMEKEKFGMTTWLSRKYSRQFKKMKVSQYKRSCQQYKSDDHNYTPQKWIWGATHHVGVEPQKWKPHKKLQQDRWKHKTNMAGLVAVTYNKKTDTENFVAFETGKNDPN